jgi:hypothetical protein
LSFLWLARALVGVLMSFILSPNKLVFAIWQRVVSVVMICYNVVFIYSRKSPQLCHCAFLYHYQLLFISNSQPTLL